MHPRVETPLDPLRRGVSKFDPLKIQNGAMYREVNGEPCVLRPVRPSPAPGPRLLSHLHPPLLLLLQANT